MQNMYKKPTMPKQPKTGGPMPKPKKPDVPSPKMPPMVQAMKEKMAMKAQKGK